MASDDEEIDVTPAMIAAGVRELTLFNPDYASKQEAVVRIFEAMVREQLVARCDED